MEGRGASSEPDSERFSYKELLLEPMNRASEFLRALDKLEKKEAKGGVRKEISDYKESYADFVRDSKSEGTADLGTGDFGFPKDQGCLKMKCRMWGKCGSIRLCDMFGGRSEAEKRDISTEALLRIDRDAEILSMYEGQLDKNNARQKGHLTTEIIAARRRPVDDPAGPKPVFKVKLKDWSDYMTIAKPVAEQVAAAVSVEKVMAKAKAAAKVGAKTAVKGQAKPKAAVKGKTKAKASPKAAKAVKAPKAAWQRRKKL
jgi:hypothetical protein